VLTRLKGARAVHGAEAQPGIQAGRWMTGIGPLDQKFRLTPASCRMPPRGGFSLSSTVTLGAPHVGQQHDGIFWKRASGVIC
jgi:hypothetical protein